MPSADLGADSPYTKHATNISEPVPPSNQQQVQALQQQHPQLPRSLQCDLVCNGTVSELDDSFS